MSKRKGVVAVAVLCTLVLLMGADNSPNVSEAARLNNLGLAYMNQQLFEKALKAFQEAAKLDPQLQIVQLNQGIALLNLGRVDSAKPLLDDAVKRNPKDPNAWYNLGLLYKNSESPQRSIDAFRRVTEIDANDADSWYFLGAAYSQNKQYPEAIDAFQHALKLNPLHASAQFGLSRAYQQSGGGAQAKEHLVRFQYITQNKLGSPISLAYGEQGKYSRAEESPLAPQKVPPAISVKFVKINDSGLTSSPAHAEAVDMATFLGPGACVIDYDGDSRDDIFVASGGKAGGMSIYHNIGNDRFEDVTRSAGLDPEFQAIGCSAGDYDNDGATDLVVTGVSKILLFHNEKNGKFKDVTDAAGIRADGLNVNPTFVDYDHDGDLDLYVTRFSEFEIPEKEKPFVFPVQRLYFGNLMLRNNGNGTFTEVSSATGLAGDRPSIAAMGSDSNNDRAVDIVRTGIASAPVVLENPREGAFIEHKLPYTEGAYPSVGIAVLDFNHDAWMDLAFTHWAAPGISLWRNEKGKTFEPVDIPATNWSRAFGIAAFDYDNDGWVDLAAVGETKDGKGEIRLFRNLGPDGWKDVTAEVGFDKIQLTAPRALVTADFDGDGATDLLITQNRGPAILLRNEGGNKNHWLKLSLKGLNDNKSAIGTKVEVFSGANHQKYEIYGSNGYLGQNSTQLIVGLGPEKQADIVRMLWPTGVLQDEVEVPADKEQAYTELDRRGSSCPTLFVWNGKRYELVGDMLGAGVIGHWVAPGERNIPRPTEYIKIHRDSVREKNGKLSFRFMEPLEEAVYLDQVRLLAVDHPASYDVFPNEYFASKPPYPDFKVVVASDLKPPESAHDDHGHDVLPDLLNHRYFGDFDLLPFPGFAGMHSLELDLGAPYTGGPLRLLMHGEIEYFTATSMYAADQAGLQPVSPYVEALGKDGKWQKVIDDMGFPAGGPRTMIADFTHRLPLGTRRIRITTNLQIYWDSILISRTRQDQPTRITSIPLLRSDLRFHGFPLKIEKRPPGNVEYVYEKASATGPYTRPAGSYTRYGDILPLLTKLDDRLAVFGSGDEVALEFDPSQLPPLPHGWVRDYFFNANGYEKDMDFYAYAGDRVGPLPFRGMGTYPYPAGKQFPTDRAHLDYLLQYNTRSVSGKEARGYAFDYKP
ncbi:MAG TPA: FG-GAP-like repeat-containing protein [Terriglobales bacterium]|nr:FG-GAP-like repeat-containing protein [Terriglobales bacterium]